MNEAKEYIEKQNLLHDFAHYTITEVKTAVNLALEQMGQEVKEVFQQHFDDPDMSDQELEDKTLLIINNLKLKTLIK